MSETCCEPGFCVGSTCHGLVAADATDATASHAITGPANTSHRVRRFVISDTPLALARSFVRPRCSRRYVQYGRTLPPALARLGLRRSPRTMERDGDVPEPG